MSEHNLKTMAELGRMSTQEFKRAEKYPIQVILDNVRSMHNIGSCFRTADAFRLEKLHLCGITATPPHREIEKAALGATLSVDWEYHESTLDAVETLRAEGYKVYAVEQVHNSLLLQDFSIEKGVKVAFVFGNEVEGVSQAVVDICDAAIEIPQFGTKHSFNISVTAGMVLWQAFQVYLDKSCPPERVQS